jgi:diguanylate cyclase (GGDEF)-like protein
MADGGPPPYADATTDPLTGLLNRRALFDRHGTGVMGPTTAVLVFDIDHFKSINDSFGHAVGDRVLKVFAAELTANCRGSDTVARHGGEEFAMVLHEVMPGRAEVVAERIRKAFEAREIDIDGEIAKCTVSVGVAAGRVKPLAFDVMLSAADKALYAAKRAGRNRVELASHLQAVPVDTARTGLLSPPPTLSPALDCNRVFSYDRDGRMQPAAARKRKAPAPGLSCR